MDGEPRGCMYIRRATRALVHVLGKYMIVGFLHPKALTCFWQQRSSFNMAALNRMVMDNTTIV